MVVIPSHCCILPLVWGLALLTTAETITVDDSVSNAVAVVPNQHMKTHTPSRPDGDRELVEERVFPTSTMTRLAGHELQPFADTLVPKRSIDRLHMMKYVSDEWEQFDSMTDEDAISRILYEIDDITNLFRHNSFLVWLGTKSPKDLKAAISTLSNSLKRLVRIRTILPGMFAKEKKGNGISYVLATAVERKWLLSMSTIEMYQVLGISSIEKNEDFVKQLGPLFWGKFDHLGKKNFRLLQLSPDELMWAKVIFMLQDDESASKYYPSVFDQLFLPSVLDKTQHSPSQAFTYLTSPDFLLGYESVDRTEIDDNMRSDKSVIMPFDDLLNELLRTYDTTTGALPIDAVRILTEFDLFSIHRPAVTEIMSVEMLIKKELLQLSPDELMWAKVIFMLRDDKSARKYYPSVFDQLLLPYAPDETQHSPSRAVTYLTSPEFFLGYNHVGQSYVHVTE
ncbi:RxLR-like protein [Plasmopara halstedii]|uniref:RxLR-like protein n=1 Tax=Plasmopara halstedii TaxID=4781 RepID=A0A0P1AH41_PLAHL|nr:RxLR-like protein [Plasmopara halstedii]CEG40414.1 RxLR-like protein [Plasmopara halstedii]|eukprot:XP_024576783.1 RxLR-like protein [Plasmopara halstedii]